MLHVQSITKSRPVLASAKVAPPQKKIPDLFECTSSKDERGKCPGSNNVNPFL